MWRSAPRSLISRPTRPARYDLHHAILRFGGYTAASEILGRPSAWPPHKHLRRCAWGSLSKWGCSCSYAT